MSSFIVKLLFVGISLLEQGSLHIGVDQCFVAQIKISGFGKPDGKSIQDCTPGISSVVTGKTSLVLSVVGTWTVIK